MSDTNTVEPTATQPSTQRKIANTVSQVLVGLAVTVAASYVTGRLNKQVENLILPSNSDN